MNKPIIKNSLIILVIVGLLFTTGYSIVILGNLKKEIEDSHVVNEKLSKENKSIKKDLVEAKDELQLQKDSNKDLEDKVIKLTKSTQQSTNIEENSITNNSVDNDADSNKQKATNQTNEAAKPQISENELSEDEPQYAVYEGNPFRFAMNNGITEEELYRLNNLTDQSEMVVGNSYRIK